MGEYQNQVRLHREALLMTQKELAQKAGIALRTLYSVEKRMNCRRTTKRKILLGLGMRFQDLDEVFTLKQSGTTFMVEHGVMREIESLQEFLREHSVNEAAIRCGLPPSTVQRVSRGKPCRIKTRRKIAKGLTQRHMNQG